MITQGVPFAEKCGHCGGAATGWYGQFILGGSLRWAVDRECEACATIIDDGGIGPAPEFIRKLLLAEHGASGLLVKDSARVKAHVLKAFRKVFDIDLKMALSMATEAMDSGWRGTYVEVEMLKQVLNAEGIRSEILPPAAQSFSGEPQAGA